MNSLGNLGTDCIENTSQVIVALRGYRSGRIENIPVSVYGHYLAMAVLYRVNTKQRVYMLQYLLRCVLSVCTWPSSAECAVNLSSVTKKRLQAVL
jgi:hypothetical protein